MLKAKQAFEIYARSHGVTIKHYHADNRRFVKPLFIDHCTANGQTIFHSRVNAHFQNSVAEKRICDLQDAMRTMLVHTKHCWPKAVNAHLWPYALCTANVIHANTLRAKGKSPIKMFSDGATATSPRLFHPFGCLVYILNDCMQAGIKGPKWKEHARIGVYLKNSLILGT